MGGSEDAGGDVSGEEAAWRDLIARFDLPVDTAATPWPARENLTETARERQRPGPAGRPGPASIPDHLPGSPSGGAADGPGPQGWPGGEADDLAAWSPWVTDAGPGAAASQDPAAEPAPGSELDGTGLDGTGLHGAGLGDAGLGDAGLDGSGQGRAGLDGGGLDGRGLDSTGLDDAGEDQAETGPAGSGPDTSGRAPGSVRPRPGGGQHRGAPGDGARVIRRARFTVRPVTPPPAAHDIDEADEDEDGRYRPPPPEPLPKLDSMAKAAWAGLLGGPGYLLAATLVGWQVSDWSALVAIVAFIAGFAILVLRLGDKPRDDDDDGAVV